MSIIWWPRYHPLVQQFHYLWLVLLHEAGRPTAPSFDYILIFPTVRDLRLPFERHPKQNKHHWWLKKEQYQEQWRTQGMQGHKLDVACKSWQWEWGEADHQHQYHAEWQDDATNEHHPGYRHWEKWQSDDHLDHYQCTGAGGMVTMWTVWTNESSVHRSTRSAGPNNQEWEEQLEMLGFQLVRKKNGNPLTMLWVINIIQPSLVGSF